MAKPAMAREAFFALRQEIARIEGRLADRLEVPAGVHPAAALPSGMVTRRNGEAHQQDACIATGLEAFDGSLGGGVPKAALTELHGREGRNAGAVAGFALGLISLLLKGLSVIEPIVWISVAGFFREAGHPYAPGLLQRFGIAPQHLLVAETRKLEEALWLAEEAASLGRLAAIILELPGNPQRLDLTATRRLHRRAVISGRPVFLLRQLARPEPSAAPLRLVVSPAPAGLRKLLTGPLAGSIGPPGFTVDVSKSPTARNDVFLLEWNDDEHRFKYGQPASADHGAVVPATRGAEGAAAASGAVLALRRPLTSAPGHQLPGRQRPEDLRAG